VKVEVKDALTGALPLVAHDSVTFGDARVGGYLLDHLEELGEKISIRFGQVRHRGDVTPRHNEDVCGRGRIDVLERNRAFGLGDDLGIQLFVDDLAKETIRHGYLLVTSTSRAPLMPSARISLPSTCTSEPSRSRPSNQTRT
jgi:hypothetical protein